MTSDSQSLEFTVESRVLRADVAKHAFNPHTGEAEAGRTLEFKSSLFY